MPLNHVVVILQLRLYAMYSLDKRVLALMGTSFLAAVGATITITCLILAKITSMFKLILIEPYQRMTIFSLATSHDVPWIPFCIPNDLIQESYLFWIPMLASESVLCGLALFRGYQSFQDYKTLDARHPSLIQALIEDSILYFVV